MDTRVCGRCGRANRAEARFCAACGNELANTPGAARPQDTPGAGNAPAYPRVPTNWDAQRPAAPLPPTEFYSEQIDRGAGDYPGSTFPGGYPPRTDPRPAPPSYSYAQNADPWSAGQRPAARLGAIDRFGPAAAWIGVILFTLAQIVALPVFHLGRQIVNPALYKNALEDSEVYTRAPDLAAEQLEFDKFTGKNLFCAPLDRNDWALITRRLVSPAWMRAESESLIDQFFAQVKDRSDPLRLRLSLAAFNDALGKGPGFQAYQEVFQNKSVCTQAELDGVYNYLLREPNSCIPRCKLPPDLLDRDDLPFEIAAMAFLWDTVDDAVQFLLEVAAEFLPDVREFNVSGANSTVRSLRLVNLAYPGALIASLLAGALLLLTLLARSGRSPAGWLIWWGAPILVVGLVCLVIVVVIAAGGGAAMANAAGDPANELAPGVVQAVKDVSQSLMLGLALPLAIHAAIATMLGGLMTAVGVAWRRIRG